MVRIILSLVFLASLAVAAHAARFCTFGDGSGDRISCWPRDAEWSDSYCNEGCQEESGQPGYCPEYTSAEYTSCRNQCFTEWGQQHCDDFCLPTYDHNCVMGQRP